MEEKRKRKKLETSKKLLRINFLIAILLSSLVVYGDLNGISMSNTVIIAGCWDAQLGVSVGFYFWKAKNENRAKGVQRLIKELAKEYGIESVSRIAELVFKD